jgi:hypothetical protein
MSSQSWEQKAWNLGIFLEMVLSGLHWAAFIGLYTYPVAEAVGRGWR